MQESHVVTSFIEHDGKVLLLKRSNKVGSYRQRWAGVSGYVEDGVTPLEQALTEIREETGLEESDLRLIKEGLALEVVDQRLDKKWIVHPFRFCLENKEKIIIDWEHTEYRWVDPAEIGNLETVPDLKETWERVR